MVAATPKKSFQTPSKPDLLPVTPQSQPPLRRSTRLKSLLFDSPKTPPHSVDEAKIQHATLKRGKARENPDLASRSRRSIDYSVNDTVITRSSTASSRGGRRFANESDEASNKRNLSLSPTSPDQSEFKKRKRKRKGEKTVVTTRALAAKKGKEKSSARAQNQLPENERENDKDTDSDEDWNYNNMESNSDTDEDVEYYEEENIEKPRLPKRHQLAAANLRKGRFIGLQKTGGKSSPQHITSHKQTTLERARATLLLESLPKSLPCRNKEIEEITTFIKGAISNNQCLGRCLYVYGVSGTGKTMSVLSVMRSLRLEVDAGNIKPFCFVEINALKLASPENIYKVIYEALTGQRVIKKDALPLLNERFVEGKKTGKEAGRPSILLIDELDLLVTRSQSVLYNIFDWSTRPHSKLIVIGISNTTDLPEKLPHRISSRMGIQRLCFAPYQYVQLQEIISSRLKEIDVFDKRAIEHASKKVAVVSGDARRALELCRRAAEIADYRMKLASNLDYVAGGMGLVRMEDVEAAIQEMLGAPHIQVMKNCSRLSKIFLTAMVHEHSKTGMEETTFEKLATTVSCLCTSNGEVFPGYDTLLQVGCKLGECKIILCEAGAKHRWQKLQLNFPIHDVAFSLRDCKDLPWLSKYLPDLRQFGLKFCF